MRPYVLAPVALGALITGYLWGYGVGEREGQDRSIETELDPFGAYTPTVEVHPTWEPIQPIQGPPVHGEWTNGG